MQCGVVPVGEDMRVAGHAQSGQVYIVVLCQMLVVGVFAWMGCFAQGTAEERVDFNDIGWCLLHQEGLEAKVVREYQMLAVFGVRDKRLFAGFAIVVGIMHIGLQLHVFERTAASKVAHAMHCLEMIQH